MAEVLDKTPDSPWRFLEGREKNVYSQFGEDGIIAGIFEVVGTTSQWCFEVGANDGVWLSNTKALRDAGWSAVLIESDAAAFAKLLSHRGGGTECVARHIGPPPNSIDDVLRECNVPREIDFGVIDIDSQDYFAWMDMVEYSPRVMCVEIDPYNPGRICERGGTVQAGLDMMMDLGINKGYIPVARTVCNAFFVRKDASPYGDRNGSDSDDSGTGGVGTSNVGTDST